MKKIMSFVLCFLICINIIPKNVIAEQVRDVSLEEELASDLKKLGLFQGVSERNFDLKREPSRTEALAMLIRFIGKEEDASSRNWNHPFTDVPEWADNYIGYAYNNGLTKGISESKFGDGSANANTYLTFILRALGYSDENNKDFSWESPYELSERVGILNNRVNRSDFWRADVVMVSYAALSSKIKGTDESLANKLIKAEVFSQSKFDLNYRKNIFKKLKIENSKDVLTAQEIYIKCSPAIFKVETTDVEGDAYGIGSGFFIDDSGIAVTNYHVLENALNATAKLEDGNYFKIEGVIDYDANLDYAIIKVKGNSFDSLEVSNSNSNLVSGGEPIYAIGSPIGLSNTVSDGIVSNPSRKDLNDMIQITAPISPGSSGGALINSKGKVVGITTVSITPGQNLNFAVPINKAINASKLNSYKTGANLLSMKEFAEQIAYEEFRNIPDGFKFRINESEPNDYYEIAQSIKNGTSVDGIVDNEFLDMFLVNCNTVGTIEIWLFSESAPMFVKDLILAVEPLNKIGEEGVESDYLDLEDGSAMRRLKYIIPRPGVYAINILSNSLYKTYDLSTDYSFYYKFTPGLTTGENTGNYENVNLSKNTPIEEIESYLLNNGTYNDKDGFYRKSFSLSTDLIYNIDYYPQNSNIILSTISNSKDGDSIYTFLNIDRLADEYYYTVSWPYYSMKATGYVEAKSLKKDTVLKMETYKGLNSDKNKFSQISVLNLCQLIDATEYVFRNYGINANVKELGFNYIYEDYSQ